MATPDEASRRFDVCNGDADGLCSVRQWRAEWPAPSVLVTGLKREIDLLGRVPAEAADEVLVCDIAMARNVQALLCLLARGVQVRWFDHHAAGEVPRHAKLEAHLDFSAGVCSSLLVDRYLQGRQRAWALVGAYGDELTAVADDLAATSAFPAAQRATLRRLGQAINYNAYGEAPGDPLIEPAALYAVMARHSDPIAMAEEEPVVAAIERQRDDDLAHALAVSPAWSSDSARVVVLPDAAWSRRVSGALANALAERAPQQAQAVLRARPDGGYLVSVRAPRVAPGGAEALCRSFGGSGRVAAAGIDRLAEAELSPFIERFAQARWATS